MQKLAMLGGARAVPKGTKVPPWPAITDDDRAAVARVLDSGKLTSAAHGEQEIPALEREWAELSGVRHCAAVANGTIALAIALAAAGVKAGDEVIVPALSFVATAFAPLHLGAIPVFADIDPATFNLDPRSFEAAIGPRTRAVVPVHLHGLPADMDAIGALAARREIVVVEDAAQAHGVEYQGRRRVGSLGRAAAFSLNVSKNLPTCGEGGLVTTDDPALFERAVAMRQFGEHIPDHGERAYLSRSLGWNAKINAIQAAFTRSQLARFRDAETQRARNVRAFLARTEHLPGLVTPRPLPDRGHGWHILRFRIDPAAFADRPAPAGALRAAVMRALRAEGVPVSRYQSVPLPGQPVFAEGAAPCRAVDVPVARAVVDDSFVLQKAHLHPDAGPTLDRYADAFEKVWAHAGFVARMAEDSIREGAAALGGAP